MAKNKKDILFLCQFFYPEHNSSATLPFDLASGLANEGFAVSGNEDSITTAVLRGVNLLGIVPVFLVSLLGITFVADTPGRRSFWVGASRVLSIIGVFTSVTVIVMLYTSGELSDVEYEYYALVRALESWLKTVAFLHLSTFVLMFFRKKT